MTDTISSLLTRFCPSGPSQYQLDRMILGMQGLTAWGAFRQSLREIQGRQNALADINHRLTRRLFRRLRKSDREHLESERSRITKELLHLTRRCWEMHGQLTAQHGTLDTLVTARLEADYWAARALRTALLEKACMGTITPSTLESIMALQPQRLAYVLQVIQQASEHPELAIAVLTDQAAFQEAWAPQATIEPEFNPVGVLGRLEAPGRQLGDTACLYDPNVHQGLAPTRANGEAPVSC